MRRKISLKLNKKMLWGLKLFPFFGVLWTLFPKEAHLSKMEWHGKAIIKKNSVNNGSTLKKKKKFSGGFRLAVVNWKLRRMKAASEKLLLNFRIIHPHISAIFECDHHQIDIKILTYFHQINHQSNLENEERGTIRNLKMRIKISRCYS